MAYTAGTCVVFRNTLLAVSVLLFRCVKFQFVCCVNEFRNSELAQGLLVPRYTVVCRDVIRMLGARIMQVTTTLCTPSLQRPYIKHAVF